MAGADPKIIAKIDSLAGKKAKLKELKEPPNGTSSKPLPPELRKAFKEKFGANLKSVQVHYGGNAKQIASKLKARAFTIGDNIYFRKKQEAFDTVLLAHELTHVLQAKGNGKKLPPAQDGKALVCKM